MLLLLRGFRYNITPTLGSTTTALTTAFPFGMAMLARTLGAGSGVSPFISAVPFGMVYLTTAKG